MLIRTWRLLEWSVTAGVGCTYCGPCDTLWQRATLWAVDKNLRVRGLRLAELWPGMYEVEYDQSYGDPSDPFDHPPRIH